MPTSGNAKELAEAHIDNLWTPFMQMQSIRDTGPLIFERGEGVYLYDSTGKEYVDGHGNLWLANVGFGREEVVEAACQQLRKMPYVSMFAGYSNEPAIRLSQKLKELTATEGMGKVFFSDSGSEAVETALKLSRQYWKNIGRGTKYKFIARRSAYHGVTFGAMSATGIAANRRAFGPLVPGFRHIPAPNCYRNDFGTGLTEKEIAVAASDALRKAIEFEHPDTVAAFIAEQVQVAGGVIIPPDDYLRLCREICDEYDVLFIADEVITGFGRIGSWFGCRHYGFKPDIMCFAKGITSGYMPLGATMCKNRIYEAFLGGADEGIEFRHGNTYSGHAAATATGLANLEIIEREKLPENSRLVGDHLLERLKELYRHPIVGDVRGVGLLARVELVEDPETRRPFAAPGNVGGAVQQRALELGVVLRNMVDVITFSPPLILTEDQADRIFDVLDQAIGDVVASGV